MKRLMTLVVLLLSLLCQAQQTFEFVSDGVQQKSAGVFDEEGRLIRTLFTGQVFPAGTKSYTWDGNADLGKIAPQGKYSVRLLSHNLKAEWEGTIGNTSKQVSNTVWGGSKRHNGYYGAAIDIYEHTNGWVYYTTGYSEGNVTLRKFHLNSSDEAAYLKVDATTNYAERKGGSSLGLASCYNICSDGQYLYASGLTYAAQAVVNGSFVMNNSIFIMKFDLSNDQMAPFSAGKSISPANYNYPSVIVLQQGLGYQASWPYAISGITVDGTYLFAAQKDQNKVSVFNKQTGALVSSVTSIESPRRMVCDGSYLWIVHGVNQVSKFAVSGTGIISSTPLLTLTDFSDPHSLSFQTVNGVKYVYITDGGSNQVVRRYKTSDGSLDITFNGGKGYFGQLGGYVNNSVVADDRFYFASNNGKVAGLHVRPDGGMWICDDGNNRLIRYTASLSKTHDVEWQGATYGLKMVEGDSTRLLSGLSEFRVDYTMPLYSSWKLIRQYEPSKAIDLGSKPSFASLVKFPNGRTYGLVRTGSAFTNGTISGSSYFVLYELTPAGLRNTGIYKAGFGWSIQSDGSLINCSVRPGGSTVVTQYTLKGFDGLQNPQWSATGMIIGKVQAVGVDGVNGGFIDRITDDGKLVFFDASAPNNGIPPYSSYSQGYHIGAIKCDPVNGATSQSWIWRSAYSTSLDYKGDYPADGKFDIGNGTFYPGGQARTIGDFITWNHHGEFWKQGQTNMHHLLYKNGLQLMQFGVAVANAQNVFPKGYPGMAGNALTTAVTKVGDVLYLWHGDESYHSGIHRWKVSGLNTVKEEVIPLYTTDKPEAHFNFDHQSGCAPLAANFTDASNAGTEKIESWFWDFGDGSTSTEQNPSHTYSKSGSYSVSLKVTNTAGVTNTYTHTDSIRVVATPTVNIVSDAVACAQSAVAFTSQTDLGNLSSLSWEWDFGNGQKSTAVNPGPQVYTTPGSYSVSLKVTDPNGCSATTKTNLSVQSAPTLTVGPDLEINSGDVAQLSVSGAERHTWSNGSTLSCTDCATPKASPKSTTVYTVTGENSAGCRAEASVKVSVRTSEPSSPLQAGFQTSQTAGCVPLVVNFTDASNAGTEKIESWFWDFGDGSTSTEQNPSHTYSKSGSYSVSLKVTNTAGVTNTYTGANAIKTMAGPAVRISGDSAGCLTSKARFKGSVTDGNTAGLRWQWDFGNGQQAAVAEPEPQVYSIEGIYPVSVQVTNASGCTAKAETSYAVQSTLRLTVSPDVQVCPGVPVQLSVSGAERHTWSNGSTLSCTDCATPKASPKSTTVYTVTGENSAGCRAEASVKVSVQEKQTVLLAKSNEICVGQTVELSASGADLYQWLPAAAVKSPNTGITTAQPKTSTTFSVIGRDKAGCFADTASVLVTVRSLPQISAGTDAAICKGETKALHATGGVQYTWQTDPTLSCLNCADPLSAPPVNTKYIVTGTDAFGCRAADTVAVTVYQPFQLKVEKPADVCIGGSTRLAASGADQYSWGPATTVADPLAGITTATPQTSTRYTVTAQDKFKCFTDTASVYVTVWSLPSVETGEAKTLSVGNTLQLLPRYSSDVTHYRWSPAETLNCSTCPNPYANPMSETTYNVEVSNNGGCKASASVTVHVMCNGGNLFIPNTFSPNGDGRNDRFYVKGVGITKVKSLKVYNRWGEVVFSKENMPANNENVGWDGSYKGQPLPPDVYIYTCDVVCQNNELLTYKGDVTLLR